MFHKVLSALKIKDGQDQGYTKVGPDSEGDQRIFVNPDIPGGVSTNPAAPIDIVHQLAEPNNGGSVDMRVNGSVTPVVFEDGPDPGELWEVWKIGLYIEGSGTMDPDDFGSITNGLTNGLLFEQLIDGSPVELVNLKNNKQISSYFSSFQTLGQSQGWLNSNKIFLGNIVFPASASIALIGDDGDKIRVTVQDNLTGLVGLESTFTYWEQIA